MTRSSVALFRTGLAELGAWVRYGKTYLAQFRGLEAAGPLVACRKSTYSGTAMRFTWYWRAPCGLALPSPSPNIALEPRNGATRW